MKIYDVPEQDVIAQAACTWCGAGVGELCRPTRGHSRADLPGGPGTAHAQRWYDHWNATHDEQIAVQRRGDR